MKIAAIPAGIIGVSIAVEAAARDPPVTSNSQLRLSTPAKSSAAWDRLGQLGYEATGISNSTASELVPDLLVPGRMTSQQQQDWVR